MYGSTTLFGTRLSDTFEAHRDRVAEFREMLLYVDGAVGAAVAIGGKVVACDLFDSQKVWERLLSGGVLDALEATDAEKQPSAPDVESVLTELGKMAWAQVDPVGEGQEWRAESGSGDYASALSFDDVVGTAELPPRLDGLLRFPSTPAEQHRAEGQGVPIATPLGTSW